MTARGARGDDGLTPRERDALVVIANYITTSGGMRPTYQEISDGLGVPDARTGWSSRLVRQLASRGYVTFLPRIPRSVCLTVKGEQELANIHLRTLAASIGITAQ